MEVNMENNKSILKRFSQSRIFWSVVALFLVLLFNFIFNINFFKIEIKDGHLFGSPIDILNRATPLMLLAIGMTFVIATGGIDISVGSVVAITGAVAASMIGGKLVIVDGVQQYVSLTPMPVAILTSLLIGLLLGLWNGVLVAKAGIQPVVATLILMVAGRGIAQLITKAQIITVYYKPFHYIGAGFFLGLPFSIFIVMIILAIALFVSKKTALGLFIESSGCNATASRFVGINVERIKLIVYTFCGLCAAIAGLIISSNVKCADGNNAGLFIELDAILAVALGGNSLNGGRFSLAGSLIGALVIQSITTTIYSIGVPPEITLVVKAAVVVIICLLQSDEFRKLIASKMNTERRVQYEENAAKF
jgi:simple sugar transport system permease protein